MIFDKINIVMAIRHKFYNTNFGNGYETNNAILDVTPYKPEVMFLGTFNPDTPNANFADFFYGRNYFWPAFKNLFVCRTVTLLNRRVPTNGKPDAILNPTLPQIFELCFRLKLTFADLISKVLHSDNPIYEMLENDNIIYKEKEYNLIQDDYDKKTNYFGLSDLHKLNQVEWNTQNIIDYLCNNPQIKHIYLTRQPKGEWKRQWKKIVNHEGCQDRQFTNIYSPAGRRLSKPVMANLIKKWIHANVPKYGSLNNHWLTNKNVNLKNF